MKPCEKCTNVGYLVSEEPCKSCNGFNNFEPMKCCKECIHSKIIIPKNPECIPEAVCTLSDQEFHDCLSNDKSRFEGNQLYLMCGGEE